MTTASTKKRAQLNGEAKLFAPLLDDETRRQVARNNQALNANIARVLLAPRVSQTVLKHYLRLVAVTIETDLRNRFETARPGSVCVDMRVPIELGAEIMRRVDQQLAIQNDNTDRHKRDLPPATQHALDFVNDNWRALRVFQSLADLLADKSSEVLIDDTEAALALFFNTLNVSRTLQIMFASDRSRLRMPGHMPLDRESMRLFRTLLARQTDRLNRREIFIDDYLVELRRLVFFGTPTPLELQSLVEANYPIPNNDDEQ